MQEEMLNTVDAVTEEVVTPQSEEVATVESVESEVATDTQIEEKPVQSKEDNAQFAEVRRKAEQQAQDKLIDEMYGKSHGIHTKAEYDKAIRAQQEADLINKIKDGEVDPETVKQELYKQWESNDPRIKEYETLKAQTYTDRQLVELNNELTELGVDNIKTIEDISNLKSADKMIELIKRGYDLKDAFLVANAKTMVETKAQKIQAETLAKTAQLDNANPGALDSTAGTDRSNSVFNMSQSKFEQMKEDALMGRLRK